MVTGERGGKPSRKPRTSSHKQEAESKQESGHSLQNRKALLQGHTLSHRLHLLSIPQTAASSFQTSEHLEDTVTEATTVPLAETQSRYCALFGRQTEKPSHLGAIWHYYDQQVA